jgi:membrane fusion protein, heavy metal efflux system
MKPFIIILLTIFIATACNNKNATEQGKAIENTENAITLTDAQLKNTPIKVGTFEEKSISSIIKVNGKIDVPPQNLVSVSVPLGGYLKSTQLLPGMHINKGDIIAVMQDQQYIQLQQDYLLTVSKLHFAELDYARQKELNASQASSNKITQQAEAEVSYLKIMKNSLSEKLKLININPTSLDVNKICKEVNIYSNISGFVSKVNVNIGKYVAATDVLFELINPTDIHLNLKVFEKDVAKIAIGQKLLAYNNTNPNKKHPCEIILISKDVSADGIAEVHCHFEDYDKTLLPGMYMNAEIEVKNNKAKALPEDAIINFEGKDYIFIETKKNEYKMQLVTLGAKQNGYVVIENANEILGSNIVLKGAYTLLMTLKNKEE